jgi:hypothetical protein
MRIADYREEAYWKQMAHQLAFAESRAESFIEQLADFTYSGEPTLVEERDGVPFFINEFWTARQRQASALHEISYRACFKGQLP